MLDLGPIKERCGKATPSHELSIDRYRHGGGRMFDKREALALVADFYDEGNREFYAHCVSDVPALVAEVERLRAEADEVRAKAFEEAAKVCDERGRGLRMNGMIFRAEEADLIAAALRAKAKE